MTFKNILKEIGIDDPRLTLHSLRHTAATLNILRGGSIESTQALLRHAHIETTKIYLHQIERVLDESEFEIEQYLLNETKVEYDI
jgi:integrase